jgi:hypothetical protein
VLAADPAERRWAARSSGGHDPASNDGDLWMDLVGPWMGTPAYRWIFFSFLCATNRGG